MKWKQTDGRTDGPTDATNCLGLIVPANAVGSYMHDECILVVQTSKNVAIWMLPLVYWSVTIWWVDGVSNAAYCLACLCYSIGITPVIGCHAALQTTAASPSTRLPTKSQHAVTAVAIWWADVPEAAR